MEKDKEKWLNDVLNSTNGIQRAKPGEFLFPKILHKLKHPDTGEVYFSKKKVAIGFLTIILLGVLNAGAILMNNNKLEYRENSSKSVIEEYFPSHSNSLDQIFNQ